MRRARTALVLRLMRTAPALLIGLALAASLVFGFIPAVKRVYAEGRTLSYDPGLVDLLSLALNVALLVALLWVGRPHRDAPKETE